MLVACGGSDDNSAPTSSAPVASQQLLFAQTDDATNQVVEFARNADGTLVARGKTPTGGKGTNGVDFASGNVIHPDSLSSNNSVILTPDKSRLFVANAGDNTVSAFALGADGSLQLLAVSATNGVRPTALAWKNGVLYVTHQQGAQQLAAYRVDTTSGKLTSIAQYTVGQPDALPSNVLISPDGKFLVVNVQINVVSSPQQPGTQLLAFPVNSDGTLGTVVASPSVDSGPFGGRFGSAALSNIYLVTGAAGATASSYSIASGGSFSAVSGPIAVAGHAAPCWFAITPDNRFGYVSSGSGAVSLFSLDGAGRLTLTNATAATEPATQPTVSAASGALDSWISPDGKFLYQDYAGDDKIVAYSIGTDGALKKIDEQPIGTVSKVSLQGLIGT